MGAIAGAVRSKTDTNVVKNPTIEWLNIPLADTEIPYTLPAGTKRFILQNITAGAGATIRLATSSGEATASGPYWPIDPGTSYGEEELDSAVPQTFYLESAAPSQRLAIFSWS